MPTTCTSCAPPPSVLAPPFASLLALVALATPSAGQVDWRVHDTRASPPSRNDFDMTYDVRRREFVLFGGVGRNHTETWLYDGLHWRSTTPAVTPSRRYGHRLCYDVVSNRTLLFGGRDWNELGDTWEWDGRRWLERKTTRSPSPRAFFGMSYEASSGRCLIFGGESPHGRLADTWSFRGADWQKIATTRAPSARSHVSMCYDARRRRIVLFGGSGRSYLGDTWEWDGIDWNRRTPPKSPPPRARAGMSYDRERERVVLFGGVNSAGMLRDTWEWDGISWTERQALRAPPAVWSPVLGHDDRHRNIMLFDGRRTWTYGTTAPATHHAFGTSCGRRGLQPALHALGLPWLGDRFELEVVNAPPNRLALLVLGSSRDRIGKLPLPLDLASYGMTSCALRTNIETVYASESVGGRARWTLTLSSDPRIVGRVFFAQAFVFDPLANTRGLVVSNATVSRIGRR